MYRLKGCPKCSGDLYIDEPELHVYEECCLQCSFRRPLIPLAPLVFAKDANLRPGGPRKRKKVTA